MPIASFVIGIEPNFINQAKEDISTLKGIEIYGYNEDNIIAVVDAVSSKEVEQIQQDIQRQPGVLSVTLTYLNVEDENCS